MKLNKNGTGITWTFALIVASVCASCSTVMAPSDGASAVKPGNPLEGTSWQLVEIQLMHSTLRPSDRSLYTMQLNRDGSVSMRLNCNRGMGTWRSKSDPHGTAGELRFGPLAMTRALCPPPSLDEQIARDMKFVRGFLLRDGRLGISLFADGGIYLWEPEPAPK